MWPKAEQGDRCRHEKKTRSIPVTLSSVSVGVANKGSHPSDLRKPVIFLKVSLRCISLSMSSRQSVASSMLRVLASCFRVRPLSNRYLCISPPGDFDGKRSSGTYPKKLIILGMYSVSGLKWFGFQPTNVISLTPIMSVTSLCFSFKSSRFFLNGHSNQIFILECHWILDYFVN